MLSTIIFDLDDTLYDEIEYCKSGLHSVAEFLANSTKKIPAKHIFDAFWSQFISGNHTRTFNTAFEDFGMEYDDELIAELVKAYRNHVPKITLPQDSRHVLEQLRSKYKLALHTDGFLPAQKLKVQALGIEEYFACIVYTEQLGREFWKPSPVGFEKIMEGLNEEAKNIVYVADNEEKDFIAPNKLGFLTIQIIRPARIHTNTSQQPYATAQYKIDRIEQLPPLLDRIP